MSSIELFFVAPAAKASVPGGRSIRVVPLCRNTPTSTRRADSLPVRWGEGDRAWGTVLARGGSPQLAGASLAGTASLLAGGPGAGVGGVHPVGQREGGHAG